MHTNVYAYCIIFPLKSIIYHLALRTGQLSQKFRPVGRHKHCKVKQAKKLEGKARSSTFFFFFLAHFQNEIVKTFPRSRFLGKQTPHCCVKKVEDVTRGLLVPQLGVVLGSFRKFGRFQQKKRTPKDKNKHSEARRCKYKAPGRLESSLEPLQESRIYSIGWM